MCFQSETFFFSNSSGIAWKGPETLTGDIKQRQFFSLFTVGDIALTLNFTEICFGPRQFYFVCYKPHTAVFAK